ncbi:MAG: VOC family protein [Bacillaceae bacterium]
MEMNTIKKIKQVGVPIKNLERAIIFYRDVLGINLLFNTNNMAFFECDGLRLLLSLPEKDTFEYASSVIYFQVENIITAYEEYSQKGILFIDKPHVIAKMNNIETWMVFFKDTEENTHALISEVTI